MSHREEVLRQAMALPVDDRAYVATILERSLSGGEVLTDEPGGPSDGISGEGFLAELERRSAAYRAGTSTARPATEALADSKARQSNEDSG